MGSLTRLRLLILSLLSWYCCTSAALHWSRALYPSALRMKRGSAALLNPTFQRSVKDTTLLYELLLAGLHLEGRGFSVEDEELGSLRSVRTLQVICQDVLPTTLPEIRRLGDQLAHHRGALRREDFERTVLTMVYTAQQLVSTTPGQQRALWGDALMQLYRAIRGDLRPGGGGQGGGGSA